MKNIVSRGFRRVYWSGRVRSFGGNWLPSWKSKGKPNKPEALSWLLPSLSYSSNNECGSINLSETSLNLYRTTWCHIPKHSSFHSHRRGNIKFEILFLSIYEYLLKLFLSSAHSSLMCRPKGIWMQLDTRERNRTELDTRGRNRTQRDTSWSNRTQLVKRGQLNAAGHNWIQDATEWN
jgi:hypothetical protein